VSGIADLLIRPLEMFMVKKHHTTIRTDSVDEVACHEAGIFICPPHSQPIVVARKRVDIIV